jgi:hypothetical protein
LPNPRSSVTYNARAIKSSNATSNLNVLEIFLRNVHVYYMVSVVVVKSAVVDQFYDHSIFNYNTNIVVVGSSVFYQV